jgi:hypothetical protein
MADVQGHNANKSGKWLESEVEYTLNNLGFESINLNSIGKKFGENISKSNVPGFLVKNSYYTNMYGKRSRGEFLLQVTNRGPIRIECRRQTRAGSVDDKVATLMGNCVSCEEKEVILVIDGGGMRKERYRYLVDTARAVRFKKIHIMNLNQFKSWANRTLTRTQ